MLTPLNNCRRPFIDTCRGLIELAPRSVNSVVNFSNPTNLFRPGYLFFKVSEYLSHVAVSQRQCRRHSFLVNAQMQKEMQSLWQFQWQVCGLLRNSYPMFANTAFSTSNMGTMSCCVLHITSDHPDVACLSNSPRPRSKRSEVPPVPSPMPSAPPPHPGPPKPSHPFLWTPSQVFRPVQKFHFVCERSPFPLPHLLPCLPSLLLPPLRL